MDPLVRAALTIQRGVALSFGSLVGAGLGGYLVFVVRERPPLVWNLVALGVLLASLGYRLARRLGSLASESDVRRLDLELLLHLFVLAYTVVVHTPHGLDGAYYPLVYAVALLGASYSGPLITGLAIAFAVALEIALGLETTAPETDRVVVHAALMALFAFLNLAIFRAELARMRRLSRARIDGELTRIREAARSYRLLGAPSSATEPSLTPPPDDEARLLHSGVDEIHQAVEFALSLLRRTLGLETAMLLGLDTQKNELSILELASDNDAIAPGPFSARDGIFGACLVKGEQVLISGTRTAVHLPYYTDRPVLGAACATPLMDHDRPRGILIVDRVSREPFSASEEETLKAAARFILRAIDNERVFVQLDRAASEHEICAASGEGTEALVGQRFRHNSGLVSMVVANRHALPYRGDYDPSRQVVFTKKLAPPAMPSLLVLPLLVHDKPLGTLVLGSQRRGAFGDAVRPTLEVLASHVAVSLSNARMLKRLEEMATTDGMTGLYNKRALTEIARQKLGSATRFGKPLSVLVCDIDHFKKVNDTYGHDVGDVVIKGFADVLRRVKRTTDAVARFGGEEFVLVCEETDERGACLLAERIRQELSETRFHTELGELSVTCSIGVAPFPSAGSTWEALFKATDEALYASKRGGRNRVTAWNPKMMGAA
jgi:two-component system cell cycle response regulator